MGDGVITMEGPPGEIVERLTSTKEKNRMYPGLPSAVRIFGETEEGGVRGTDGRSRESGAALEPSPSLKGR